VGGISLALGILCATAPFSPAESLFRAGVRYDAREPLASRSLFTPPIARQVGDLVVILVDETTTHDTSAELKITRTQTIDENGSTLFNSMVGFVLDKLPFNTGKLANTLRSPSFNGLDNSNELDSKAESKRSTALTDNVACQVTQVLPNGDLMVQGEKVILFNKERQTLMVSGIVKPYYLDRNNQISSKMVGGFQMIQGGKGVISRQQNDGIANKIYQFFN
jgi:flagellar L-ring protein precursor FlgH